MTEIFGNLERKKSPGQVAQDSFCLGERKGKGSICRCCFMSLLLYGGDLLLNLVFRRENRFYLAGAAGHSGAGQSGCGPTGP